MTALPLSLADLAAHRRGILYMLVTTFFWVASDTLVKLLSADYSTVQILWARYTFHFVLLLAFLRGSVRIAVRTRLPLLQIARSSLTLISTAGFFVALTRVPIADANAVFALTPVLVTVLSVPLLGETVGPRRWFAAGLGFFGALVIIRPGLGVADPLLVLALASGAISALYQILTRRLGRAEPVLCTVFYTPVAGLVVSVAAAPFFWTPPDAAGWGLMLALGLSSGIAHTCIVKAMEAAPASVVAPLGYSSLVWATLLGFVVFGHLPDGFTVLGALLIVSGGLYIFYRERRAAAAATANAGEASN